MFKSKKSFSDEFSSKKNTVRLDKFSSKKNPFEFYVSGEQILNILENFPDPSRIKRGINCSPLDKGILLDTKKDCTIRDATNYVKDYSEGRDLETEVTGKYSLYWNKKRKEYTHKIILNGARELGFYLEFGTNSSQKSLDEAFHS